MEFSSKMVPKTDQIIKPYHDKNGFDPFHRLEKNTCIHKRMSFLDI